MMEEERYDYSFDEEAMEAVQKFETMKKNNKNCFFDVIEFESIIDYYIESNNSSKAYEAASLASQQHPNSISIQLRKAKVYLDKGRAVEALGILKMIESIEPGNDEIYIAKGTALGILGDIAGAKKMFDYALSLDTDDEDDLLFTVVSVLQNLNYYEHSIPYLLKLIEREPDFKAHIYDLAYAYERVEDYDNSIKYYLLYLDEEPYSDSAWYNLGIIYNKKEQFELAIEAYDFALAVNSQNTFAIFNKANISWHLERYDDAIQIYHEYLEHEPDSFEAMTYLAECYERKGDYVSARKHYLSAIEIAPDFADPWYGMGVIEMNEGHFDESLGYLRTAVKTDAENPDFWFALGKVEYQKNEVKAALKCYREALRLDSYFGTVWADFGRILIEERLVDKAIPYLQQALKVSGDIPGVYYLLASFFNYSGNEEMTLKYLSHAVDIDKESYLEFNDFFPNETTSKRVIGFIKKNKLI